MSFTSMFLYAGAAYLPFFVFCVLKAVWVRGAIGEEVSVDDVILIFARHMWKLVTLPVVAFKAACR